MSSRHGRVVLFMDVANEAVKRVLAVESEKSPAMSPEERRSVANQIGLGALAYSILGVDNGKDIVFDMDTALSFEGRTGPYIQNAHVRAASILKKAGEFPREAAFGYTLDPHEVELIELISRFPETVQQAANEYRPLIMANYAYDLASSFHSFFHAVPVIQTEDAAVRSARLRLVAGAKQAICNALALLDIQAPEVM